MSYSIHIRGSLLISFHEMFQVDHLVIQKDTCQSIVTLLTRALLHHDQQHNKDASRWTIANKDVWFSLYKETRSNNKGSCKQEKKKNISKYG